MHMSPLTTQACKGEQPKGHDFEEIFYKLEGQFYDEEGQNKVGYHFPNVILYKVDNILVPKVDRTQII